jgi:ribose 5-phosphate isomerase B
LLPISDAEIHQIVQRAVARMFEMKPPEAPAVVPAAPTSPTAPPPSLPRKIVAIASDHGGFELKEQLKGYLGEMGYEPADCGTHDKNPVDYPDFALAAAQMVSSGKAWRGIVIDGAGIGSCMAANKVPGVRAALCYDHSTAVNSREHNDANLLTLGAGLIGPALAKTIVKTWLETAFGGGRHAARVEKIMAIEKQYFKSGS